MIEKHWFIFRGDHHLGPFSFDEILGKVKLAELNDEELVWREGDQNWLPVGEQPDIRLALDKEKAAVIRQQEEERARLLALEKEKQEKLIAKQKAVEEKKQREREEKKRREEEIRKKLEEQARLREEERRKEEPPPLPPLPPEAEIKEITPNEAIPSEPEEKAESELEGEENFAFEEEVEVTSPYEILDDELEGEISELESEDEESIEVSGTKVYVSVGLSIVGVVCLIFFIMAFLPGERPLSGLSTGNKDALENVRSRKYRGRADHRLRPSLKLNALWLGSNFPGEAAVYLRMTSVPGRVLGGESLEVQSHAILKGGAALFDELEFLTGDKLAIGEYRYEIRGKRIGLIGKFAKAFGDKPVISELRAVKESNQEFVFKGEFLLAPYTKETFAAELSKYKSVVNKTVVKPLKDRLERYKTFLGLLERVNNIYKGVMRRITKGRSIYLFENQYNEEVGPFLRDLIIDSNRMHISLMNLKPKDSKSYEDLMNYGKDIGIVASDMVTKTRRYRTLGKERTDSLLKAFDLKVSDLRSQGLSKVKALKGDLAPYMDISDL